MKRFKKIAHSVRVGKPSFKVGYDSLYDCEMMDITIPLFVRSYRSEYSDQGYWLSVHLSTAGYVSFWADYTVIDAEHLEHLQLVNKFVRVPIEKQVTDQYDRYSLNAYTFDRFVSALEKNIQVDKAHENSPPKDSEIYSEGFDALRKMRSRFIDIEQAFKTKQVLRQTEELAKAKTEAN